MKIILLISIAMAAVAQQAEPPKTARIEGRVVSTTGGPVPRATVRLGNDRVVTADDEGRFVFDDVPPSSYILGAQRTGYVAGVYGARTGRGAGVPVVPVVLRAGEVRKDVVIAMPPQVVFAGRITNAAGDSVAGVRIAPMQWRYLSSLGQRTLSAVGSVATDDKGEYRLSGLVAGTYYVAASDTPAITESRAKSGQRTPVVTLYPGVATTSAAKPVTVLPGDQLRLDMSLQSVPAYAARGRLVDTTGKAVTGVALQVLPGIDVSRDYSTVARPPQVSTDGTFEVTGLLPGSYTIRTALPRAQTGPASGAAGLVAAADFNIVGSDVEGIVLQAREAPRVTGKIAVEDGTDPSAATGLTLFINSPETGQFPSRTNADLTFAWDAPVLARYTVFVFGLKPGYYVKSAKMGDQDLGSGPLDLTTGIGGRLDIVIANKAADIAGVVKNADGEALANVLLTLWTEKPYVGRGFGNVTARSDQNGAFQFQNLRPGDYYVGAWEDIDGIAQYPAFLNLVAKNAASFHLEEGMHHVLEVSPISVEKIKAAEAKLP